MRGTLCMSLLISPRNFNVCLISYHISTAIPRRRALRSPRWVYEVGEIEKGGGGEVGEACFEDEWEGLGSGRARKNKMILRVLSV